MPPIPPPGRDVLAGKRMMNAWTTLQGAVNRDTPKALRLMGLRRQAGLNLLYKTSRVKGR